MADSYTTVRVTSEHVLKVQGSRFIAVAAPAADRDAAMAVVDGRRAALFDARHHAFAYRVTVDGQDFRSFDDGEPAGTAGRPILAAIDRELLTNVVVVVTRYFGGTKLGVGGLVRAYGKAASAAIAAAGKEERPILSPLSIVFPHAAVGQVMHVISSIGGRVSRSAYDEEVHLTVEVGRSRVEDLFAQLREATRGTVRRTDTG